MSNQCGCNHWTKPVCPKASCPWNEWKAQQNIAASKVQRRPWAPGGPNNELPTAYYTSPPAQQEPVAKVCHDLDGHIGWNPNLRQLPDEGAALYTSPPTLSLAQRPHECSRSHPHENMNAMCELRTEIARLTNENARLKAMHQDDEINTYRMTLLCIRDGLQQGMSKSIQKLQAREINDVLGLPSFASYRTSPPAQRKPLTDKEISNAWCATDSIKDFVKYIEAAHGIKENT